MGTDALHPVVVVNELINTSAHSTRAQMTHENVKFD
jgi:hypothetical protein